MATPVRTAQRSRLTLRDPLASAPRVYAHTFPMVATLPDDPLLLRPWEPGGRLGIPNVATPPRSMGCPEYHDYLLLVRHFGGEPEE